jgi:hypothetical protein
MKVEVAYMQTREAASVNDVLSGKRDVRDEMDA